MNYLPQVHQSLAQQPQGYHLPHNQTALANPVQPTITAETVMTPSLGQINTVALVQYGGIAAAIILSISVFILCLAKYNEVFIPVMLQQQHKRQEQNNKIQSSRLLS